MFITLEGIEGVGKTTHLGFIESHLAQAGIAVCSTREPGGTVLGNELRSILLAPAEINLANIPRKILQIIKE